MVVRLLSLYMQVSTTPMGRSKKDPYPTHPPSGEGGRDCLKNALNLYRMSGEGEGGIANFLRGGMDLFWNNPKNGVCFKDRGPSVEIM